MTAVDVLAHIGGEPATSTLVRGLFKYDRYFDPHEPTPHSTEYIKRALLKIGPPAIPHLLQALDDPTLAQRPERIGRWRAAWVLGQMRNTSVVPTLIEALSQAKADVRPQIALALGYIGDIRAIPALQKAQEIDPVPQVRENH